MADRKEQLLVSAKNFETGKHVVLFPFVGTSCKHNHTVAIAAENGVTLVACPAGGGEGDIIAAISDETKARLERLEAIEAAMKKSDDYARMNLMTGWMQEHLGVCQRDIFNLIREGMKDNVPE